MALPHSAVGGLQYVIVVFPDILTYFLAPRGLNKVYAYCKGYQSCPFVAKCVSFVMRVHVVPSENNQGGAIKAYITSRYLGAFLNIDIDTSYFEQMISPCYPTELQ